MPGPAGSVWRGSRLGAGPCGGWAEGRIVVGGRVIHVHSKPRAQGDVDRLIVDKVFDPPGFAKADLIAGHEQVIERNPVIGQPFSRAVLRPPQIAVGADHNPPPVLPEPLHETDAVGRAWASS